MSMQTLGQFTGREIWGTIIKMTDIHRDHSVLLVQSMAQSISSHCLTPVKLAMIVTPPYKFCCECQGDDPSKVCRSNVPSKHSPAPRYIISTVVVNTI